MGYAFRYDPTGTTCVGGPRPGAVAVGKWAKARWGLPLIGIYNCRQTRTGSGLSTHAEGRGIDAHVHARASEARPTAAEKAIGDAMFALFIAMAEAIGVQAVIWLDKRWDSRTRAVKHYTGPFHGNHVHIELCRAAAENLKTADLDAAAGEEDDMQPDERAALLAVKNMLEVNYSLAINEIRGNVQNLVRAAGEDPVDVDEQAIANLVLAGLDPKAIASAIPADLAEEVAKKLAERLAA